MYRNDAAKYFVHDYVKTFGVKGVYLPATVIGEDDIMNENLQTVYNFGGIIHLMFINTPTLIEAPIIDKFGLTFNQDVYVGVFSKLEFGERFPEHKPKINDLFYCLRSKTFFEVMEVSKHPDVYSQTNNTFWNVKFSIWQNNQDLFGSEIIKEFEDMGASNDLVLWRRKHDVMGYRFPDQHGDTSLVDELNQPLIDDAKQVFVDPNYPYESPADEFIDAMNDVIDEKKKGQNKKFKKAKDFGWS